MARRRKLLFLAEGATSAHFIRPLALAGTLDPEQYDIHFHAPERFHKWLAGMPFAVSGLPTMPPDQFLANLARGAPLFPAPVLRGYVQHDRQVFNRLKPDLVIGDLRFSLPVSAQLENVRSAVLMNAYWSPLAQRPGIIPELPITRLLPPAWLSGFIYRWAEPRAWVAHMRPINQVRAELGLPELPPDPRQMYTSGDFVLYPDPPGFTPIARPLPANHHYVETCNWEMPGERPPWWQAMAADARPKVLVSLGSSGPVRILPRLLSVLAKLPVAVILSTSGRELPVLDLQGIYAAPLLPLGEAARLSSLVVSHGGSSGLYPALAAAVPVLGIPSNADQHIASAVLHEQGAGLSLRVEEATEVRLASAINQLLNDARFRDQAAQWAPKIAAHDSSQPFARFLSSVFAPV